ncbi:hypothetical protein ARALYDRAFT_909745 [Arabidopsis lyrata subsp. lyrata]|uniref:Uncharacterized protein n=1 Tax=Arabidopsis lyrata subsp. lyrata TaxID=81972 RepID=D7LX12_ARALL|nr:hypothetical protein ARALYDRAFT_909745 [Arabidopsis lyrata subsp. lyrata]
MAFCLLGQAYHRFGAYGAIPHLVKLIKHGSPQSKADAVMALSNLSTVTNTLNMISEAKPKGFDFLENGTLQGREHAVGALLTLCQSGMSKYREPIPSEGVIPSLLELTVQGT